VPLHWQSGNSVTEDQPLENRSESASNELTPWGDRVFGPGGSTGCAIGAGLAIFLAIVALASLLSQCSPASAPEASNVAEPSEPAETDIVAECDMSVKQALVSYGSYDPAWEWSYKVNGNEATVLRRFEATNGFGAKVSSTYLCKWNIAAERITSLQTIDALGHYSMLK
jgi:hypothetical protein